MQMKDLFGKALLDYVKGKYTHDIVTATSISDEDVLPLPYLFRTFDEMPILEQEALQLCKGSILDIGCGSGSHSLYLQEKGFELKAIDSSLGAVEASKLRGVKNVNHTELLKVDGKYDTILLLMNGTGIFQTLNQVSAHLTHLKLLLNPNGQILIDSSDILYMYEDEDGGYWYDSQSNYYGELDYYIVYKDEKEIPFKWLYLDFNTLKEACIVNGLDCELVLEGEHFDYLAKLTIAHH